MNNHHHCARTTVHSRELIVHRTLIEKRPVIQVALEFGISERTVYKWIRRYKQEGHDGLLNRSSKPLHSPHRLSEECIDLIETLFRTAGMKAKTIAQKLKLAYSTVTKVLRRLGLTKSTMPRPQVVRYEKDVPGEMIHLDIKKLAKFNTPGHRSGAKRGANKKCGYEYVHVCIDDHSRWAYVEVLNDETKETTLGFIQRALQSLKTIGITVQKLMTDNGSAYRSKLVKQYLQAVKIKHVFTKPYTPKTNGKAERFIQTLCREWAYAQPFQTSIDRKKQLPDFLNWYNLHRPHSGIGHKPPASRISQICEQRV